jgi:hypothetical protein
MIRYENPVPIANIFGKASGLLGIWASRLLGFWASRLLRHLGF